jgi:hypothetical protein
VSRAARVVGAIAGLTLAMGGLVAPASAATWLEPDPDSDEVTVSVTIGPLDCPSPPGNPRGPGKPGKPPHAGNPDHPCHPGAPGGTGNGNGNGNGNGKSGGRAAADAATFAGDPPGLILGRRAVALAAAPYDVVSRKAR